MSRSQQVAGLVAAFGLFSCISLGVTARSYAESLPNMQFHHVTAADSGVIDPSPSVTPSDPATESAPAEKGNRKHKADPPPPAGVSAEEAKLGKEGAKEVEKELCVVKDPVALARLQGIIRTLEKATPYPDLPYTVAIVTPKKKGPEPEINAFSLPGGYIYVTKDLLDAIQSDDELAAVLGHEMGHVIHHHEIKQIKAQGHDTMISMLAIIAALIAERGRPSEGTADVAMMGPQIVQALHSKHSMQDETEADMSGIDSMYYSKKYNPSGMLTFMQRLALDERRHPQIELGYLQDHPSSSHRVQDIEARLKALHVPINIRMVSKVLTASVVSDPSGPGATLRVQGLNNPVTLCHFTAMLNGYTAAQRAEAAAKAINDCVDRGEEMGELSVRPESAGAVVLWGTTTLFAVTEQEAGGSTSDKVAREAVQHLQEAIWADSVARS